jgi:hypothetical protein
MTREYNSKFLVLKYPEFIQTEHKHFSGHFPFRKFKNKRIIIKPVLKINDVEIRISFPF